MSDRPNILFIHTDQQRSDTLGCYGNDIVQTPNIDGLADNGVIFEEAHCSHPLCMPSRGTLLTGRYPSAHGIWRNGIPLPDTEVTIANVLSEEGYSTGLLGKAHFTPYHGNPDEHIESIQINNVDEKECWEFWRGFDGPYYGFDHIEMAIGHGDKGLQGGHYGLWLHEEHPRKVPLFSQDKALEPTDPEYNSWKSAIPLEIHSSKWVADRTIEFIEKHAQNNQPFYGWVGIPDPHFPYTPPEPYCYKYNPDDVTLPVDPEGEVWGENPPRYIEYHLTEKYGTDWRSVPEDKQREIIAHYWAMVDLLDDQVGRILDTLEEQDIADDTLIVFTSDHGDWLGDHGLFQKGIPHTRELTRVPCIIKWPGITEHSDQIDFPISQIDMMPTLLDAAGADIPYGVQGESLRSVLADEAGAPRPYVLVEHRHERFREDSFFIQNLSNNTVSEMKDSQDNLINWGEQDIHVKTVYTGRYRLSYATGIEQDHGELFDLEKDPTETINLWYDEPELRNNLLPYLVEALIHTNDPLPEREYPV